MIEILATPAYAGGYWVRRSMQLLMGFPEIVCLCGSNRFIDTFRAENLRLTLEDRIVLSVGCNTKSDVGLSLTPTARANLDELHKRKIDLADRVHVLNVGGYVGDSTRGEIEYALAHGKTVSFLEDPSLHPAKPS